MDIEFDIFVFHQRLQHRLERIARIDSAVAVIDVVGHTAPGGPGEQHRRDIDARIMNDLRETIDGFLETGIEAVDEEENPAARHALDARIEIGPRLGQVHAIGAQDGEVTLRIGRQRRGERNVPRLAGACRRNRDDDIGEIESVPARAAEHHARRLNHGRTRRRNKEIDPARVRRARADDQRAIRAAGAAGGERRQPYDTDQADTRSRRCFAQRREKPIAGTGPPAP